MVEYVRSSTVGENYWVRHAPELKSVFRILFGVIWLIDGALKFAPGFADQFPSMVSGAADGQPAWLAGWFAFWSAQSSANPAFWVYTTGILEVALGFSLVFGFLRKIAYAGGVALSLLIWAVPEGFGGPYGPGSTDVGTGITYAVLFLALIVINATYGASRWSLDAAIERRWPAWARFAELRRLPPSPMPAAGPTRPPVATGGNA